MCVLSISLVLLCQDAYRGPALGLVDLLKNHSFRYGPAISVSLLLLPIVMFDVVRMSNRFLRPVARLKQGLRDVADGRPAQPLNFRDDKFWDELAADFNRAAGRISRDASERHCPTEEMPQHAGDSSI
jgi:nitrogen fixation/metabolism regulation signal transduction histidine kinase